MRRLASMVAMGIGGLALAVSLSLGALAIAGGPLGQPASANVQISGTSPASEHPQHEQASPAAKHGHGAKHHETTASPSPQAPIDHSSGGETSHGDD
jgi:hypothetical protein